MSPMRILLLVLSVLISSCNENMNKDANSSTSSIELQTPQKLASRAQIDKNKLSLTVLINESTLYRFDSTARIDSSWQVPIEVNYGSVNDAHVSWYYDYNEHSILLAEQKGSFFADASVGSATLDSILETDGARLFDVDRDGKSNFREIVDETSPLSPDSGYISPELVDVETNGECFTMGSPIGETDRESDEEQVQVCLDSFRMGVYEVTFVEYELFVKDIAETIPNPSSPWGKGLQPLARINHENALAYAAWLSEKSGRSFRDGMDTGEPGLGRTQITGSYAANGLGLHDINGNVAEWTCSEYQTQYMGAEQVCVSAANRLISIRGGAYYNTAAELRSAARNQLSAERTNDGVGFRLVELM